MARVGRRMPSIRASYTPCPWLTLICVCVNSTNCLQALRRLASTLGAGGRLSGIKDTLCSRVSVCVCARPDFSADPLDPLLSNGSTFQLNEPSGVVCSSAGFQLLCSFAHASDMSILTGIFEASAREVQAFRMQGHKTRSFLYVPNSNSVFHDTQLQLRISCGEHHCHTCLVSLKNVALAQVYNVQHHDSTAC